MAVVIVTEREPEGWVTGAELPDACCTVLLPQPFTGVRGWIEGVTFDRWTPLFAAVDHADHEDRAAFNALMDQVAEQGPMAECGFYSLRAELALVADGNGDLEVHTTDCFDCGTIMPVLEAWSSVRNPDLVLCAGCCMKRDLTARARSARRSKGAGGSEPGPQPPGSLAR